MTSMLLWAFLIGVIAGLRALTAPAAVAWAGFGHGILNHTPLRFMGRLPAALVFTVLALLEMYADQLPSTASRLAPAGLISRIVTGGLSGACLAAAAAESIALGCVLGAVGGVVGAFAGYYARTGVVKALKVPDLPIALLEDAIAIGGAIFIVSRF
ncbi:MAG: hypothetical protein ABSF68_14475 [Candidatus Acidiferrales bacterium]